MKTCLYNFKKFAILLFYLVLSNGLQAQIISNIGGGFGFFRGEPSSFTIITTADCTVQNSFTCFNSSYPSGTVLNDLTSTDVIPNQSFNIQFANLSYEPRLLMADSVLNSFSVSLGMPLNFSFILQSRDGFNRLEYYEEFDMAFQGALITYLNFGNGSSHQDFYSNKYGFSIGGGMMYSYLGIFKNGLNDLNPPPNNLLQPVVSLNFRYLSPQYVLSEFNIMMRPAKEHVFKSQNVNDCCETGISNSTAKEFGILIQYKLFFGQ